MTPVAFAQANTRFGPPGDLEESQCKAVPAFRGAVQGGSVDGANVVVVAWLPAPAEVLRILHGQPIFLSCLGGLPPHFLSTTFEEAIKPS